MREKEKVPDTSSIYDYILKTQASNADKALIDSAIVKLTLEGKIINKKPPRDLDSFYNSKFRKAWTHFMIQIPPISITPFSVKLLHQLTKIYRHLYAKVLLQTV